MVGLVNCGVDEFALRVGTLIDTNAQDYVRNEVLFVFDKRKPKKLLALRGWANKLSQREVKDRVKSHIERLLKRDLKNGVESPLVIHHREFLKYLESLAGEEK